MASTRFKKGDLVIIDDSGRPTKFEILSYLTSGKGPRFSGEPCYEARNVTTGLRTTISEDQILRLATPIDNSAELFKAPSTKRTR